MTIWEEKARKEGAKFDAERLEIEKRLAATPSLWDRSKAIVVYFTALVALGAGAWGLIETVTEYFHQRQQVFHQRQQEAEQAEKAYEFNVNQEFILLTRQLASTNAVERNNAALLLSGFEEHAVPILVANLQTTDKGALPEQLINSLDLVLSKKKSQDKTKQEQRTNRILTYVAREAEAFFDTQYSRSDYDLPAMKNYITALGKLGARAPSVIDPVLNRMKGKIQAKDSRISNVDRDTLLLSISEATSKVAAGVGASG